MSENNGLIINDYLSVSDSLTLDKQIQVTHDIICYQSTSQHEQSQESNDTHLVPLDESISLHAQNSVHEEAIIGNEQFISCCNDCAESSFLHDVKNQNQKDEPPTLHLRGYIFLHEQMQVTDESIVNLSGSTHLNQQILDLIFELKPLGNYSSVIYGEEHFVPNNKVEKVLLLGLLKRSVILFGTQEMPLFKSRYTDVDELYTLSNEFVLSMVKFNQHELLLKILQTIVICSNYNSNILLQYALLLDKVGHHNLALEYFILIADESQAYYLYFIIIHSYYVHFNDFDSGIKYCLKLLDLKHVCANLELKSKGYLYLGIGYYLKLLVTKDIHYKKFNDFLINKHCTVHSVYDNNKILSLHKKCADKHYHILPHDIFLSEHNMIDVQPAKSISESLPISKSPTICINLSHPLFEQSKSHLLEAVKYDSNNHILYYYLSLVSAQGSNMTEAMVYIKQSLMLNAEYLPSLHLLVLLESASNVFSAENLLESIIQEYPDNVQLYITQAHISMRQENYTKALDNLSLALIVWENLYGNKDDDHNTDNDSGQYSVDDKDKIDFSPILPSPSDNSPNSNKNIENQNSNLSNYQLKTSSKHVTFQLETPCEDTFPLCKPTEELSDVFPETTKGNKRDTVIEEFYIHICKELASATICHDKLPSKLCLLIDILGLFVRVYLKLNSEEDFVQCLHELFQICVMTSSYEVNGENILSDQPLVVSDHCAKVILHLGIYFENQRDLKNAKICFHNVLDLTNNNVEALYHLSCIEKDQGILDRALLTVNHILQFNNLGVFKGKLYFLMGEILDSLMEPENASAAYEVALKLTDDTPVCSFDILPFVWQ